MFVRNTLMQSKLIKGNIMPDSKTIFRPVTTAMFASLMLINTGHGQSNSAPVLSFNTPAPAEMFEVGSPVFVHVNASDPDGSVSNVRLSVDGDFLRQENVDPYEWGNRPGDTILENLSVGVHTLTAVATDNDGAATTETIIVEIIEGSVGATDSPVVSFASPGNGETFAMDSQISVTVNATDPDGDIENVRLFVNGDLVRQENAFPYEWEDSILQNLDAATHELLAVAVDNDGNSTAESITITIMESDVPTPVPPTAPPPVITPPVPPSEQVNCPVTADLATCVDDMADNGGGVVTLEGRTYFISDTITMHSDVTIAGQGPETVITWEDSIADSVDKPLIGNPSSLRNFEIRDLTLLCTVDTSDNGDRDRTDNGAIVHGGGGTSSDASSLEHQGNTFRNLQVRDCGGTAIGVSGHNDLLIDGVHVTNSGWGTTDLWHNIYLNRTGNVTIRNSSFTDSPSGHGMRFGTLTNVSLDNVVVEGNADHGIHMNDTVNVTGNSLSVSGNCAIPRGACRDISCFGDCSGIEID